MSLQAWMQPSQRSNHRVSYHEALGLMVLYGGDSFVVDQLPMINVTYPSTVKDDMWVYNISKCDGCCITVLVSTSAVVQCRGRNP